MQRGRFEMAAFVDLEHLVGTGCLYNGPKQICHARYRVDTYLEPSEDIIGKSYLLEQLKEIRGKINPIELSLDSIFGRDWTLVLEDGRKLDFFIYRDHYRNYHPYDRISLIILADDPSKD